MKCTKCGKEAQSWTSFNYYWAPITRGYRSGNQIVREYNKAKKTRVPIAICDDCVYRHLKWVTIFQAAAAVCIFIGGAILTAYLLLNPNPEISNPEEGIWAMAGLTGICSAILLICALTNKSKKSIKKTTEYIAQNTAYNKIFIPGGGRNKITMWRE